MKSVIGTVKKTATLATFLIVVGFPSLASDLSAPERLAIVRSWIPQSNPHLQLIFEYESENPKHSHITSNLMHRAIDKAGRTVTILQAKAPYDQEYRTIGGYNPNNWRSCFGRYELNAGRFIFDLEKNRKWERTSKRIGSIKVSTNDYGLSFGGGDLIINANLQTGSARNNTFAPPSNSSVLMGQAGAFSIGSIHIYKVLPKERASAYRAPIPFSRTSTYNPPRHSIPDTSSLLVEVTAILSFIIAFKFLRVRYQ